MMKEFLNKINFMVCGAAVGYAIGYRFGFDGRIASVIVVLLGFGLGNTVARMLDERRKK